MKSKENLDLPKDVYAKYVIRYRISNILNRKLDAYEV
jgi:hypothetical protein